MTSPPFAPHPFGDHPHFSPCAGATGKPVLTARVLGTGGQGPRVQDQLQGPGLVSTVLAGTQRPGPLLPLPISVYGTSPLSWDPGPLPDGTGSQLPEAVLWAQAPGRFLGRAASLSDQVQVLQETGSACDRSLKAALGVSRYHLHSGGADAMSLGGLSATGRGLRAATEAWAVHWQMQGHVPCPQTRPHRRGPAPLSQPAAALRACGSDAVVTQAGPCLGVGTSSSWWHVLQKGLDADPNMTRSEL